MSAESAGGKKEKLFTRDEVLGGLSGRRARALLFLAEYWSTRLAWQSRRRDATIAASTDLAVYAPILLDDSLFKDEADNVENDADDGFYRAFGLTREGLPPATARQVERYAGEWARLVPDNPRLRAQVARLLLEKYPLSERACPNLRAALGLDTEPVRKAYQSAYNEPLAQLYAPHLGFADRLKGLFGRK